jgi:rare lipoprotein A
MRDARRERREARGELTTKGMFSRLASRVFCLVLIALLSACGTTPKKPQYYSDDGPPDRIPDNLAEIPNAVPRDEPFHRYANRPYTVFGRTYVPVVNKEATRERGIASWYGKKFHGQKTSSGEPYDMFAMTAAHPTLPIPSYARVTNLKTGAWVVVRINDRGPFHSNRVIDLSYAAASRIGVAGPGSGLVEVERVFEAPEPDLTVAQTLPPPQQTIIETPLIVEEPAGLWLQLGAFSSREAAENFRDKVTGELSWLYEPVQVSSRDGLHRVRLGPYRNRDEAAAIADKVRQTLGFAPTLITR